MLKAYGPITKNSILLNANDGDLKDLVRNIVKEMQQISRIYRNMEFAASKMLHRAQKYEIAPSLFEDPNITTTGIYTCLTDEIWWLQRLPQYLPEVDFDEWQRIFIGQYAICNNTEFEVKIAKLRFQNGLI